MSITKYDEIRDLIYDLLENKDNELSNKQLVLKIKKYGYESKDIWKVISNLQFFGLIYYPRIGFPEIVAYSHCVEKNLEGGLN